MLLSIFVPEASLIALREGLEAFLIVGILLGFVTKLGRAEARRWVWFGLGLGIAGSLLAGLIVERFLLKPFEEAGGAEWFELIAALVAIGVLTYMVFWMWQHTRSLIGGLRQKIGDAVSRNTLGVITLLTFASVIREGLEVVLFYGALGARYTALDLAWSGLAGMLVSVAIVVVIFRTTVSFNLQKFFGVTGLLLIFVAAGLLVHSVHAATSLGLLPSQPALWDTGNIIPDDRMDGRLLHALVGYTAQPTLLQALLYFGFLFGVGLPYLASMGLFRERPSGALHKRRVAIAVALVWLVSLLTVAGAVNPAAPQAHGHDDGAGTDHAHDSLTADHFPEAKRALAAVPGKVGVLVRDHGEIVHYNATTYETIKQFVRDLWPYTGLPAEVLDVDQGTFFLDEAHPFDPDARTDAHLVDAWLQPWTLPAVPANDEGETGLFCDLPKDARVYLVPGAGPGQGEGDFFELCGLSTYRDWLKMENHSPRDEQGRPAWARLAEHLAADFGDKVVVEFAHGLDPKVDAGETLHAAAGRLAGAGVGVVVDAYQSSIHSDAMNTCMMRPHAEHALHEAGFQGRIISAGQAGHDPAWARAVAARVEELLASAPSGERVSVHLVQHGATPGSKNPCGDDVDQYHANALREYELAVAAIHERLPGRNLTLRHVYGQGAGAPGDGVLSPREALDLDRADGLHRAVMLPFEFWGDGVDNLVYFRESLGFQPSQSPYFDAQHETRFTQNGIDVRIASAAFGTEAKADALLGRIVLAFESLAPPA